MIVLMGMSNLGIMVLMVHVHDSKSRSILEVIDIVIMDLCGVVCFCTLCCGFLSVCVLFGFGLFVVCGLCSWLGLSGLVIFLESSCFRFFAS